MHIYLHLDILDYGIEPMWRLELSSYVIQLDGGFNGAPVPI